MSTIAILTVLLIVVIVLVVLALGYVSDADEDGDWIDHD